MFELTHDVVFSPLSYYLIIQKKNRSFEKSNTFCWSVWQYSLTTHLSDTKDEISFVELLSPLSFFECLSYCTWSINIFEFVSRYLLDDQIRGRSSVQGYITSLQKGCRCVECKSYRVSSP